MNERGNYNDYVREWIFVLHPLSSVVLDTKFMAVVGGMKGERCRAFRRLKDGKKVGDGKVFSLIKRSHVATPTGKRGRGADIEA